MKAIVITTDNEMEVVNLEAPLYRSARAIVGGYIEIVTPRGLPRPYCMVANEQGLLEHLPYNHVASVFYQTFIHGSPIVGDVLIMKMEWSQLGLDTVGLDEADIAKVQREVLKIYPVKIKK